MYLDAYTLMIVIAFVSLLASLLMAATWLKNRQLDALLWWSVSFFAQALGTTCLLAHNLLETIMVIDLGHMLIVFSAGLVLVGARDFNHRANRWPLAMIAPVLWLAAVLGAGDDMTFADRLITAGCLSGVCFAFAGMEMWRGTGEANFSQKCAGFFLGAHAIFLVMRIPFPLVDTAKPYQEMQVTPIFAFITFEALFYCVGLAFLLLAMTLEQGENRLRHLALTDPLTGATNRRGFEAKALKILANDRKSGRKTAVLAFDLDHFKRVNDTFGHEAGDRVLQVFAQTAQAALRRGDLFARMGGEEFAAILRDTDLAEAIAIAERLRKSFMQAGWMIGDMEIGATTSIGIVVTQSGIGKLDDLLECADEALYRAKEYGRNRSHCFEKPVLSPTGSRLPDAICHPA